MTAAASGVAALGTAAIKSYADYEQLVGGVETLFSKTDLTLQEYADSIGKTAEEAFDEWGQLTAGARIVQNNAEEAFRTAGLSANEYMETVTSFSASLLQSLDGDTKAAAEAADQAVIDMSDNANKMGTSMESIQNAYQGFAKQNYTMLDNLKLGYGGTKSEMERLLSDAEKLTGIKYDINNLSDVYSAIHVIQEELGITGTTAKEASTTISGSLNMAKAAWSNLLTGIADDSQDFDTLVDNLVDSVSTVAENILPRVEISISGVGKLVEKLLPVIINRLPKVINNVLPKLVQSGTNMVSAVITGLEENLPAIMDGVMEIADVLLNAFITMAPQLMQLGIQIIISLIMGISSGLPQLIPSVVSIVLQMADILLQNIGTLTLAALQLIQGLADGLIASLPILVERLPEIVMGIVSTLIGYAPQLLEAAGVLITTLAQGLAENLPIILEMIILLVAQMVLELIKNAPQLLSAALEFIMTLANALITYAPQLLAKVPELLRLLKNKFLELVSGFAEIGSAIVDGIWSGISAGWSWLVGKVKELAKSLFGAAKDELDINSPSKKFEWLAKMCVAGWDKGSEGLMSTDMLAKNVNANLSTLQMNIAGAKVGGSTAGFGVFNQTVNVNQPVSTPDELARAMRLEARYGLMKGVPVGA